ncbi:phosphoesterase [Skermanella stibiiresistens SB22]|uniref:Phosphoesterase n=1 Tax=Skermanella stibiiresistens SB22 TaxID=1385369 RepID=W9H9Z0_9PROT|nr:phosphatase PAP2 family protein [Skermanella stibiiresistens]EWY40623.1 phosphoesterase [Skermanella stibiiresistens SB22]
MLLSHVDHLAFEVLRATDPAASAFFRTLTEAGDSKWTLVPTGVIGSCLVLAGLWLVKARRAAAVARWTGSALLFVFASIALSGIIVNIIKVIIGRARPKLLDQIGFQGFDPMILDANFHSFPSGHTNTAVAFALAVSFLIPGWRAPLLALAGAIGFSRVAVNAHFMTDVIGGAALAYPTTYWLRARFAAQGWVFARSGAVGFQPQWPGRLLARLAERSLRRPLDALGAPDGRQLRRA